MNIGSFLRILTARWTMIAGFTLLAIIAAGLVTYFTPSSYTSTTELIIDGKGQDPVSGQSLPTRMMSGYIATQADIIRSRNVANKVIDQLALDTEPSLQREFRAANAAGETPTSGWLLSYLKQGLTVTPGRDSSVLGISFNARDPQLAARIADGFAQAYIRTNLELRIDPARQISEWYDQQLASLRDTLVEKQNALSSYQEEHGIVVSSDRLDLETAKLSELSSMLIAAQAMRLDNQSRSEQLSASTRAALPAHVLDNPQVQRLSTELAQAEARLNDVSAQVGSNHPSHRQAQREVNAAQNQLDKALKLIGGSMQSTVELSASREAQLKAELAQQKEQVLLLNRMRNELNLLRQEVDSAQVAYDAALARATQTRLESRSALTDIAVLNMAAVPSRPTHPKPAMNLLLGAVAGFLLGVAFALCREWMDWRVRSPEELETRLGIPVLAIIPAQRKRWPDREFAS